SICFFILALTLGTVFGTYSSIFTASPLLIVWRKWSNKREKA
ncbi:protein translocase subunit SecF, partial [Candidatus Peregrinibacteria bacterium]|nr:protein translocase subunit SecF [Candidatus Peregrinibacteria bacterium]